MNRINALVAPYFWVPVGTFTLLAILFHRDTRIQLLLMLAYFALYRWIYVRLVNFKRPRWLLRR